MNIFTTFLEFFAISAVLAALWVGILIFMTANKKEVKK